jgi:hypothetical protein
VKRNSAQAAAGDEPERAGAGQEVKRPPHLFVVGMKGKAEGNSDIATVDEDVGQPGQRSGERLNRWSAR